VLRFNLKHPKKKHRDWLSKLKAEGIAKRPDEDKEDDSPKVLPAGAWLWRCFNILNAHRVHGDSGPQPITISDIHALSSLEKLSYADARWLLEIVGTLDRVYLEEVYDKLAKERAKKQKQGKAPRGRR